MPSWLSKVLCGAGGVAVVCVTGMGRPSLLLPTMCTVVAVAGLFVFSLLVITDEDRTRRFTRCVRAIGDAVGRSRTPSLSSRRRSGCLPERRQNSPP